MLIVLDNSRWYIRYTYHDSPTQGAHSVRIIGGLLKSSVDAK